MRLKDIIFTLIILILVYIDYIIFNDLYLAFFLLLFLGSVYLENETNTLWHDLKTGKLRLWEIRVTQFKEYYEVIKWWLTIIIPVTFGLTSMVIALRVIPEIHPWVLLTLFMWAFMVSIVSFTVFLGQTKDEKAIGGQILVNSLFLWLFIIVTALLSGFVASFFKVSSFEDLAVCILPIFIYELFRLDFLRNSIWSVRFSSIDQALRLLDLAEKGLLKKELGELASMKSKIATFLQKTIALTRQGSEILSEVNSRKNCAKLGKSPNLNLASVAEAIDTGNLLREGEQVAVSGPFTIDDKLFLATRMLSKEANTGFTVLESVSQSIVSDVETIRKVALCTALFDEIEKTKATKTNNLHVYRYRVYFVFQDRLNRIIGRQILNNLSRWLSSFDIIEKKKHETNIDLDITALTDHILRRSLFYNSIVIQNYENEFSKVHSYVLAFSVVSSKQREIGLYEEAVSTWKQREGAAKLVSPKLTGANYLAKSSGNIRASLELELQTRKEQLASMDQAMQSLLSVGRTENSY
jgi:hypothetical protein